MDWFKTAQFVQEFYVFPLIIVAFVAYVGFRFVSNYTNPAKLLNNKLSQLASNLEKLNKESNFDKDLLDEKFASSSPSLNQAWLNYKNTLHHIRETVDGEDVDSQLRATVPSEVFFSESTVIDIPLKVDFYRHLPGMITGVGIIVNPPQKCYKYK